LYEVEEGLLVVATDRLSAFDVVLPNAIPWKGAVLTGLTLFWLEYLKSVVPNHLLTTEVDSYPDPLPRYHDQLEGRSMLVVRADVFPVECVARGYLAGSGWKEYQKTGAVCGVELPSGLRESDQLPEPIFTPSTKEETGHDINITEEEMAVRIGWDATRTLKKLTLACYTKASSFAEQKGIIIADTKFEFGVRDGQVILVDEALTPDSSRFWPRATYEPGRPQQSFDKQYVRDYLEALAWNKQPPAPDLPGEVIAKTSEKYLEAYRLLTGRSISDFAVRASS
jgi:phosphoribosylaminoimidazole-succinocarboxamide synthase